MNFHEFVALVQGMRHAQRTYFASRARESLVQAKKLEKMVDAYISNALEVSALLGAGMESNHAKPTE